MSVNMMAASLRCSVPRLIARVLLSARRRNCRSSLILRKNFLRQRLESRLTAQVVQDGIYFDADDVVSSTLAKRSFQSIHRLFLVAHSNKHEGNSIGGDVARFRLFRQPRENFLRLVPLSGSRIRLAEQRERKWIVVQFDGFSIFSDCVG